MSKTLKNMLMQVMNLLYRMPIKLTERKNGCEIQN